ncbi:MAG: hypothetical protein ACK4S4_12890 [Pyrinomonadaceae bacterium]
MRFSRMNNPTEDNLEKIIELMRTDDSVDAPAASISWAKELFRPRAIEARLESRQGSAIRKIFATLTAELGGRRPAFGERSAGAAAERQMLFSANEFAIDLRVRPAKGKRFDLAGQILGPVSSAATVTLSAEGFESVATVSDASEFEFRKIPAASYELTVRDADGGEIVIPGLDIR